MGNKLEGFLRVLGSGLSKQAFAANVGMYTQEKAQEADMEKINITQMFKTLGPLGVAMKNAKASGDMEAVKEISAQVKASADKYPKHANNIKNAFMAGQMQDQKAKAPENIIHLISDKDPKGRSFRKGDERINPLLDQGYRVAPKETLQGTLTTSQKGKVILKGVEGRASLAKNITEIDNLKKTLADPNFIGGVAGSAIQGLDSAVTQVQQLFDSGPKLLKDDGSLNEEAMDLSAETISRLEKSAGQSGLAKSQTLQLAYIIARANDPNGRLSDRDVKTAEGMLGEGSNPRARGLILDDVKRRLISNYNIDQASVAKSLGKPFKRITMKEIKGLAGTTEKTVDADTPASRILKDSGLF